MQEVLGHYSGAHAALDQETLAVIKRASPLPLPEIKGNPVEVRVPVEFFIQKH